MQLYTETSGRGPELVMLHGWGLNSAVFEPLRQVLKRSFSVTMIDLPGHGLSPASATGGLDGWTDAVLDAAPPRAHWFGWSLGGLLALNAALRCGERVASLALIGATPRFTFDQDSNWLDAMAVEVLHAFRTELESGVDETIGKFLALQTRGIVDDKNLLRDLKDRVLARGRASADALAEGLAILEKTDLRPAIQGLQTPALVVSGGRDSLVPPGAGRWLAQALENGKWVFIDDASHLPFLTHWPTLGPIYEAFCQAENAGEPERADPAALYRLDQSAIRRSFNRAAGTYESAAVLHRAVREDMLDRLDWIDVAPTHVMDLGAGPGGALEKLATRYPAATVHAVDIAGDMLAGIAPRFSRVCADALSLPFAPQSFELVFSNLMLHYCGDPEPAFKEIRRVLKPHGCLTFSTFGPDTLNELRQAWAEADRLPHVMPFIDMHDIGDAIVRAGFQEPVLDVERYTLTYDDLPALMKDLKAIGATNPLAGRARGLTGREKMAAVIAAYEKFRTGSRLPATFEVIYGQAWAGPDSAAVAIPVDRIGRRR